MFKKLSKIIYISLFASPLLATISCSGGPSEQSPSGSSLGSGTSLEKITIHAKHGWWEIDTKTFEENLEKELDNQFDIVFDNSFKKDKIIMNNILASKADLGFSSITQINLSKKNKEKFVPKIQTMTNSFTFDPEWSIYSDGTKDDSLIKQAKQETKAFATDFPYQSNTTWNNSIYTNYYDTTKKVDFYRGNIWIYGTQSEIDQIKTAWQDKNWENFRNFGIMHGETTSGGTFKLQESLLKKHFTKNGQAPFTTLAEEANNHSNNFKKEEVKNFAKKGKEYHIGFDDNGSFAYTANANDNGDKNDSKPFEIESGKKLEILTVTEPLKYDIGIFRKDFKYQNILTNALLSLQEKGLDIYGPTYGYNGYKRIDPTEVEKEVYEKWENILG